jgi:molybdopterin-guanine dinucleotide biosynthesis protein A
MKNVVPPRTGNYQGFVLPSTAANNHGRVPLYDHGVDPVTAFVLAGGKSSRMGQDKAFLQLGGRTLLARALEVAGAVAACTWIVGSAAKFAAFGRVVEDVYAGQGPLAGIHAGLAITNTDLNLVLALDLPFLDPDWLRYLIFRARQSRALVVTSRAAGGLQPLCAVYRRSFAEVAEHSLRSGRNKIDRLFTEVEVEVIEPEELARNGFSEEMFRNVNTAGDWEAAKISIGST